MAFSYQSVLQLGMLLAFALLVMTRGRRGTASPAYLVALACLALAAFAPHTELLRGHRNGHVHVHPTEFYHYYLGTKYFDELGYYGLYQAATVAEYELAPSEFRPEETIRHLRRPAFEMRKGDVLKRTRTDHGGVLA